MSRMAGHNAPRGLRHTYTRGRTTQAQVHATPTAETLYEWRKRVKDLGYQVRLLEPMWPGLLGGLPDELERFSRLFERELRPDGPAPCTENTYT
ncbi:MAG: CHAD domain-containing protein [Nitrospirales bacterium]